jgi:hypothetical protein
MLRILKSILKNKNLFNSNIIIEFKNKINKFWS